MKFWFTPKKMNCCYTYFRVVGEFDPNAVTEKLGLKPDESWKIGDKRKNGSLFDFAAWHFGKCEVYTDDISEQMQETIKPLLDKIDLLNQIRNENEVRFYLEVVPRLYSHNHTPSLAPSVDVMAFCAATQTEIDIDLYIE